MDFFYHRDEIITGKKEWMFARMDFIHGRYLHVWFNRWLIPSWR